MPKIKNDLYLILDNIRSILNVGAIFRTADAAGIKKIYLCGITGYPSLKEIRKYDYITLESPFDDISLNVIPKINYQPSYNCIKHSLEKKIAKTALKALGNIEWEYRRSTEDLIKELGEKSINIIALEQTHNSTKYTDFKYKKPLAIIVGNEVYGISQKIINLCSSSVEIPMHGAGKSLNVATATGIILYRAIENS